MNLKKLLPLALVIAFVLVGYVLPALGGDTDADTDTVQNQAQDQVETGGDSAVNAADTTQAAQFSDLAPISLDELPIEALDTLDLIDAGGPYPFDRDDLTFQNREGLLPQRDLGHYREYTVITPGENDRGARRFVAGADGELYYTADHYSSFAEVVFDPVGG